MVLGPMTTPPDPEDVIQAREATLVLPQVILMTKRLQRKPQPPLTYQSESDSEVSSLQTNKFNCSK